MTCAIPRMISLTAITLKKAFIFIISYLIVVVSVLAQCPNRDSLWKRIVYFKESLKPLTQKELEELLGYLDNLKFCPYKNDTTHVALVRILADACVQRGDFLQGAHFRLEAINIISRNAGKPSIKVGILPGIYYWLSLAYDSLNNVTEKMRALDSCIATSMRLKQVDRSTLTALESRVQYFFDVGDYQRCIDYARLLQSLGQKYADDNTGLEHLVGESAVYTSVGWEVKALLEVRRFQEAEELLKGKLDDYRKAGLKDYMAMIYSQLAGVQEQKGEYYDALSYFQLSLKYYVDIKDYFNCKQTTKDMGNVYLGYLNDLPNALTRFQKALTYTNNDRSQDLKDAAETLDIYASIATIYVRMARYDLAHHYYGMAFDQIKPGVNETTLLNSSMDEIKRIKKIHYLTGLIIDKGDAYRKQFEDTREPSRLSEAIRIYKIADQFLNKIKSEQTDIQSKLFWRSDSRRLYENAIDACFLGNNVSDAFYFFEKSRAVLLQDQLNEQRWSGQDNILKQTQLEKMILQLERDVNSPATTSSDKSDLEDQLFKNRQELAQLQEVIKKNDPLYYQSFVDKSPISIQDVQQKILKDHQALVELFAGDSAVYVLAITGQRSYLQKFNKIEFDRLSDGCRNLIANAELLNKNFNEFKILSQQLYRLMFKQIDLPTGRIIISPDGPYFPFESLVVSSVPLTYFLDDHAVSYTYSARYLLNSFSADHASTSYTFIGIAPVQYNNGLPALAGSDQSLKKLVTNFSNTTNLIRTDASKKNFLRDYYKYKIIQLYTHAKAGGTAEPVIYFSDSALLLSDLFYEHKPSTSLIVLSACETAEGKLYNGEGVFSFNRQFAALGIPSSIANLWQVDNTSSYKITELFYKYLAKGLPLDVALQKAKKEFRSVSSKEKGLPYYWAASILVGQCDPIPVQKLFPWIWMAAVAVVLLLIVGLMRISRRKKVGDT